MRSRLPKGCAYVLCALLLPAATWAGVVVDGHVNAGEYGTGGLLAVQRIQTQFGDDTSSDQWGGGSELDRMFVTNDNDFLYIGLSGNLENNGNCIVIFIDVDGGATGAYELYTRDFGMPIGNLPRYLTGDPDGNPPPPGLDWLIFDNGFAPNYCLGFSGGSPVGSQTRSYYLVNWSRLAIGGDLFTHDNEIAGMITAGDPTASGSTGTLGSFLATASLGILGAGDNSNDYGVEGGTGEAVNDPATAATGFEFAIPLSVLGVSIDDPVCIFALVSSSDGWISNQMLPPPETETIFENIGNRNAGADPFEFSTITGNQYVCYVISEPQGCPNPGSSGVYCSADIDGTNDCRIDLSDLAQLLGHYGQTPATHADGDLNGNNVVELSDLAELLGQYGDDCN